MQKPVVKQIVYFTVREDHPENERESLRNMHKWDVRIRKQNLRDNLIFQKSPSLSKKPNLAKCLLKDETTRSSQVDQSGFRIQ